MGNQRVYNGKPMGNQRESNGKPTGIQRETNGKPTGIQWGNQQLRIQWETNGNPTGNQRPGDTTICHMQYLYQIQTNRNSHTDCTQCVNAQLLPAFRQ